VLRRGSEKERFEELSERRNRNDRGKWEQKRLSEIAKGEEGKNSWIGDKRSGKEGIGDVFFEKRERGGQKDWGCNTPSLGGAPAGRKTEKEEVHHRQRRVEEGSRLETYVWRRGG